MNERNAGFGLLGVGAVACIACCAGPLLAFLGGVGLVGIASTLVLGAFGVLIAVGAAAVGSIVVRRRARVRTPKPNQPVAVAPPTRKS